MPILHHTKTHERFFFIHIPRTAGRFLMENFIENGYNVEHHLTNKILKKEKEITDYLWTPTEGVEISHATYPLYNKWKGVKGRTSIAIIRNPIDRFFSSSFSFTKKFNQSSFEDWTSFKDILSTYKSITNWWRPQHEFISPYTRIWKYENGFGEKFCNWINTILPINFSIKTKTYSKVNNNQPQLIRTKALINNIKKFYHKDFEDFD